MRVPQHIIDRVRAECLADGRQWPAPIPYHTRPHAPAAKPPGPGIDIDAVHRSPRWKQIETRKD